MADLKTTTSVTAANSSDKADKISTSNLRVFNPDEITLPKPASPEEIITADHTGKKIEQYILSKFESHHLPKEIIDEVGYLRKELRLKGQPYTVLTSMYVNAFRNIAEQISVWQQSPERSFRSQAEGSCDRLFRYLSGDEPRTTAFFLAIRNMDHYKADSKPLHTPEMLVKFIDYTKELTYIACQMGGNYTAGEKNTFQNCINNGLTSLKFLIERFEGMFPDKVKVAEFDKPLELGKNLLKSRKVS